MIYASNCIVTYIHNKTAYDITYFIFDFKISIVRVFCFRTLYTNLDDLFTKYELVIIYFAGNRCLLVFYSYDRVQMSW